jgi:hypothetical protein
MMPENIWVDLLRRIPAAFHDGLVLATVTGADLVMQGIIRLDENFLILRGRPAGTSDAGKLMVLPYHQINYLFFPGRLTEPQMQAMFGGGEMSFAVLPTNLPTPSAPAEAAAAEPVNDIPAQPAAEPAAPRLPQHSKTMLLAKLRAKLAGDNGKPRKK